MSFQLTCMCRILCAVLTARGSDITKNNCSEDPGSICENCGADGHAHHTSQCKNPTKCINCGKDHLQKSNICEIWLKEKAIMKLKVTNNISYLEAKKLPENKPETTFSKIQ